MDRSVSYAGEILSFGAACNVVGSGLAGVQLVSGLTALYQTFLLGHYRSLRCRVARAVLARMTSAAFVAISNRFVYLFTQGATDMPSLCLAVAAAQLLLSGRIHFAWLSGTVL